MGYIEPPSLSEVLYKREKINEMEPREYDDLYKLWQIDFEETNKINDSIYLNSVGKYISLLKVAEGIWGESSPEVATIRIVCV